MDLTLPRLRDDAIIRRFDGGARAPQFVVAIDGRHFVVGEQVAALLEMTRHSPSLAALAQGMSGRFGSPYVATELGCTLHNAIPAVFFRRDEGPAVHDPLPLRVRLLDASQLLPALKATSALFGRAVVIPLVCFFLLLDALVGVQILRHGLTDSGEASLIGAMSLVLAGVAAHELGHLSACHRYGAAHGGIGVGLYWFVPVFYAEVHGAWLLSKTQRAVVDIAGIYFQCLFLLTLAVAWLVHPSATLLLALWVSHFLVLSTLNPVLKYDGYWLLSDLSGRHNLHRQMREIARRCWRRITRQDAGSWPSARERMLLAAFLLLALAYFAYVLHFMAHNIAYACNRFLFGPAGWSHATALLGLLLAIALAMGVTGMLARSIGNVIGTMPKRHFGERHGPA
jgi:putative peptide zinc metalloprotease protein